MKIAGIVKESMVDGEGVRAVLFVQGCKNACKGCQNPQTWPKEEGEDVTPEEVAARLKSILTPLHAGVTFSGGEPFEQAEDLAKVAELVGGNVWVYSGLTLENILIKEAQGELNGGIDLLEKAAVLVDGPFIEAEKDLSLQFRGSRNQRIIKIPETRQEGRLVLWEPRQAARPFVRPKNFYKDIRPR